MRRTLISHPYKDEVVGGVNSHAVAFNNWVLVGGLLWFTFWLLTADMSTSVQADTIKPPDAGMVYAVATPETMRKEGGIEFSPPEISKPDTALTFTPTPEDVNEDPKQTPTPKPKEYKVTFSYYNPALLSANCMTVKDGECVSTLSSGDRWQDKINKGVVAVPPRWIDEGITSIGLQLEILYPSEVAGIYDILDQCTGCDRKYWMFDDGQDRIDILSSYQALRWGTDLVIVFLQSPAESDYTKPLPQIYQDLSSPRP